MKGGSSAKVWVGYGCAGLLAAALFLVVGETQVPLTGGVFATEATKGMRSLLAFDSAWLVAWWTYACLEGRRAVSWPKVILRAAASAAMGWLLASLCCAFPPVVLFLCKRVCPEAIYFGRSYTVRCQEERRLLLVRCGVAFASLALVLFALVTEGLRVAVAAKAVLLGIAMLGAACPCALVAWMKVRGCKDEKARRITLLSCCYRGMELWAWVAFAACITLFVGGWC